MKTLLLTLCLIGCSAVTPADRAVMYSGFARDHKFKCSAYHFDLSAGLVSEVPEMTEGLQVKQSKEAAKRKAAMRRDIKYLKASVAINRGKLAEFESREILRLEKELKEIK